MDKFTTLTARACPLGHENIDTDQLIPARFMSRPRAAGYSGFLMHDLRFTADGASRDFILDQPAYAGARVLVTRRNFGTGSSREAAVYALWDFGIRCIIAPSFGDIFASNAVKNGLLPAQVSEATAEALLVAVLGSAAPPVTIDLETRAISCASIKAEFAIDPVRRLQLINGWDDLDLTLQHVDVIGRFCKHHHERHPWAVASTRVAPEHQ
ncbi:MAG: 3-isopropylmalate dehydratase small subunit [Beijerinckiaceae bacterium]